MREKKTKCHAPFTHNILVLIEKLGWETTKETLSLAAEINEFNTEERYPDHKLDFQRRATKEFREIISSKEMTFCGG